MHKIYRRNRKVYAHNPDPVVTGAGSGKLTSMKKSDTQRSFTDKPTKKVEIPSGLKVLLGNVSFDEAFAYHKSKGKSTFSYKGKKFTTETAEQERDPIRKSWPKKEEAWPKKEYEPLEPDVKTVKGKKTKTVKGKKTKTTTNIPYHMKNPYGVGGPKI